MIRIPKIVIAGYWNMPELLRMGISAIIGVLSGLITYEVVFCINPLLPKATTSWFIAFLIGVIRQHSLHRWLTFNHETRYWKSLYRAYVMYTGSLFATTGVNWLLTSVINVHHRIAWGICLLLNALISLLLLKRYVFKSANNSSVLKSQLREYA